MSGGKLIEPKVITDFHQRVARVLPVDCYFDEERWEKTWQRFEEKGDSLGMADLNALFPDENTLQSPSDGTGEAFNHRGELRKAYLRQVERNLADGP